MSGIGRDMYTDAVLTHPTAPVTDRVSEYLPQLRRYARAVTGSQTSGDARVRAALEVVLGDAGLQARIARGRVELYQVFSEICKSSDPKSGAAQGGRFHPRVSPIRRQALVLTQLEQFSPAQAGQILGSSAREIARLVEQAMTEISAQAATDVLIIEDEPLISSHIEAVVEDMGHRVVAIAATARHAYAAYAARSPGLVLADIPLADDSTGLAAVDEILAMGPIPIIFIAASPEKLLTGQRPEPSFLVAKPFREDTLRAMIGHALFFGARLND